ncbi:MAG: Arm DNA-binding domain-containing protein [Rhodocyclaceae bacterium]|nr:Arm DNA-binding domain-containing protein [Rhodocyclaceae bacterium]
MAALFLLVKANGAKLWRYRYKLAGKENLYALGEYSRAPAGESEGQRAQRIAAGYLTLAEARIERDRAVDWWRRAFILRTIARTSGSAISRRARPASKN